jgi:hypothetical protein
MLRKKIEHQSDSGSLLRTFNLDLTRLRLDGSRSLISSIKWQSTTCRNTRALIPTWTMCHSFYHCHCRCYWRWRPRYCDLLAFKSVKSGKSGMPAAIQIRFNDAWAHDNKTEDPVRKYGRNTSLCTFLSRMRNDLDTDYGRLTS